MGTNSLLIMFIIYVICRRNVADWAFLKIYRKSIMEARNNPSVEPTLLWNPDLIKLIDEQIKGPMQHIFTN